MTNPWILAARPKTLSASVVPVAVGTASAMAAGTARWDAALAALGGAIFIQVGTNLANDVFDAEKGADTAERLGPTRAVQAGLLDARAVRIGMVIAFGLAGLLGLYLTWIAGPVVLAIGVASVISGVAYTAGPFPLAYVGLGDLFVMVFFGFVAVCGTAFVQAGLVPPLAWWASVPVGAISTGILVVNNIRDRNTDVKAGKRTLAVRLGRRAAEVEYIALTVASYAVPPLLYATGRAGAWILLPMLTLPEGVRLCVQVVRVDGAPLNDTLAHTARLLLLFGILLSVGMAL